MNRRLLVLVVLLACGRDPAGPPSDPLTTSSMKARFQADLQWPGAWLRADSLVVRYRDSALVSRPDTFSRCVVWPSYLAATLRYVVYGHDAGGVSDSLWAELRSMPQSRAQRHGWAQVEEFYGPGNGIYATYRSVQGECGDTAGSTP